MKINCICKCQGCDEYICLSNDVKAKSGKHIPLNATGQLRLKPHSCTKPKKEAIAKEGLFEDYRLFKESKFCICGHHIETHGHFHISPINSKFFCNYAFGDLKYDRIRRYCSCSGFQSIRLKTGNQLN